MKRLSAFRLTLILIVLGLVAISILLGVLTYQGSGDEDELADEVEAVKLQIARLEQLHDIDGLEAELARLVAQINDTPFPEYVDDNVIFDLIRQSATITGVTVESWTPDNVSVQPIDGSASGYRVYGYEVTASGTLSNIFAFLREMEENAPYETVKLDDVKLDHGGSSDSWSIEFEMMVFAQP